MFWNWKWINKDEITDNGIDDRPIDFINMIKNYDGRQILKKYNLMFEILAFDIDDLNSIYTPEKIENMKIFDFSILNSIIHTSPNFLAGLKSELEDIIDVHKIRTEYSYDEYSDAHKKLIKIHNMRKFLSIYNITGLIILTIAFLPIIPLNRVIDFSSGIIIGTSFIYLM